MVLTELLLPGVAVISVQLLRLLSLLPLGSKSGFFYCPFESASCIISFREFLKLPRGGFCSLKLKTNRINDVECHL